MHPAGRAPPRADLAAPVVIVAFGRRESMPAHDAGRMAVGVAAGVGAVAALVASAASTPTAASAVTSVPAAARVTPRTISSEPPVRGASVTGENALARRSSQGRRNRAASAQPSGKM